MRFGLFGGAQSDLADSARGYDNYLAFLLETEALGYHGCFLTEHHFTGWGQVSAPLHMLSWLAARTTRLRLGTAVMVLAWHNPMLLAEQAATVDVLSGGRLDLGIGRGYRHKEFHGFALDPDEAEARFAASLQVMTRAWTITGCGMLAATGQAGINISRPPDQPKSATQATGTAQPHTAIRRSLPVA